MSSTPAFQSELSHELPLQAAAPVAAADRSRLALLDTVRLLAAIGIVWIHAAQSPDGKLLYPIGTFGVPFYTFVAVLFALRAMQRDPQRTVLNYIGSRIYRVYLPFLAWTAIYVALTEAKAIESRHTLDPSTFTALYAGGHQHLWFLPYLMAVTISAVIVLRWAGLSPTRKYVAMGLCIAAALLFCVLPEPPWIATRTLDYEFWAFAFRGLPSAFGSIAFGLATVHDGRLPRTSRNLAGAGLIACLAALALEAAFSPSRSLRAIAGFSITLVALFPLAPGWALQWGRLGRYSYGIYLSHVVFLRLLVGYYEHAGITPTIWTDIMGFVIAFTCGALLSVAMSRSVYTRWMLGE